MPTLAPTTHDWTHEPGGYRIAIEWHPTGWQGFIEHRQSDGKVVRNLISVGEFGRVKRTMRSEISAGYALNKFTEEIASMLLAQLADHD